MVNIEHDTLVDVVTNWAQLIPDRTAQTHLREPWRRSAELQGDPFCCETLSYGELDRGARGVAAFLQAAGVRAGDRAVLLYPSGLEFTVGLLGCMYAGVIPAPVPLPRNGSSLPRVVKVFSDARPTAALTIAAVAPRVAELLCDLQDQQETPCRPVQLVTTDTIDLDLSCDWKRPPLGAGAEALLQYTSGSSASPKGVVVTHRSLLENQRMIARAFGHDRDTVVVAWLPTFHDMGLIGNTIQPICLGATSVSMSPLDFLRNPARWLQMLSHFRGTTSGAPNFAYDQCVRRVTVQQKEGLDLSNWRLAYNGAEPVHAATLDRFCEAFEPCGFRRSAFFPCYGLAEATLFVAGAHLSDCRDRSFDRSELEQGKAVLSDAEGAQRLIGCGPSSSVQEIAIVDPERQLQRPEGVIGEVWVRGPSVANSYFGQPEPTFATFGARLGSGHGPFLRTGDLGFIHHGDLYITGRLTDLIIIRGRNIYPQDVERAVQDQHEALKADCGAAFTVRMEDEDRLVVMQEAARSTERKQIVAAVREAIARAFDVQLHDLVLIAPGTIPRTSSGKVMRRACRTAYVNSSDERR